MMKKFLKIIIAMQLILIISLSQLVPTMALGNDTGDIDFNEIKSAQLLGDINDDGEVDAQDLVLLKHKLLRVENGKVYEENVYDVKVDSKIDILDIIRLKKIVSKVN